MEKFKGPWKTHKLAEHGYFTWRSASWYCASSPLNSRPISDTLKRVRAVTSSLGLRPCLSWKFQSFVERDKIGGAWSFLIVICSMLLCIIPLKFRPIAEILKELERWRPGPISQFHRTHRNWPSMATLNSNLLYVTVHHPFIFQADIWNP